MCSSESLIPAGRKLTRYDVVVVDVAFGTSHGVIADATAVSGFPAVVTHDEAVAVDRDGVQAPIVAFAGGGGPRFLRSPTWPFIVDLDASSFISMGT